MPPAPTPDPEQKRGGHEPKAPSADDLLALMNAVEARPEQTVEVDLEARTVVCDTGRFAAILPDGTRKQLLEGSWNAAAVLLEAGDAIEATASRLPYVSGFGG